MRCFRGERIRAGYGRRACGIAYGAWRSQQPILVQQIRQCEPADAAAGLKKEIPSVPDRLRHGYSVYKNSLRLKITLVKSVSDCVLTKSIAIATSLSVGGRVSARRYARSICFAGSSPTASFTRFANSLAWLVTNSLFIN